MDRKITPGRAAARIERTNGHCGFALEVGERSVATFYADIISSKWRDAETAKQPENAQSVADVEFHALAHNTANRLYDLGYDPVVFLENAEQIIVALSDSEGLLSAVRSRDTPLTTIDAVIKKARDLLTTLTKGKE